MGPKSISITDLYRISTEGLSENEVVIDVRTPAEFSEGHIKGSLNISHDQIHKHVEDLKRYKLLYIHCRSGARAAAASQALAKAGFTNVVCISGSGMENWIASGFPVQRNK